MRNNKNSCKHQIKVAMYMRFATEEQARDCLEKVKLVDYLNNFIKTYLEKTRYILPKWRCEREIRYKNSKISQNIIRG